MATDTTQTPWVWARTPDGRKVRVPRHYINDRSGLTLAPSEKGKTETARVTEPAPPTPTRKAQEATR